MASSLPAALDYLVEQIPLLDAVQAMNAQVHDGWPTGRSDQMIVIGITPDEDDTGVSTAYAELSGLEYEEVILPSTLVVRRAGRHNGRTAMSAARFDAFRLLDAIRELLVDDRRLGGAVVPGLPARMSTWRMIQTDTPQQAGEGRTCQIDFNFAWTHRGG